MASYTAPPISVARFQDVRRVELVFDGVEQAGPSFEARVFLNNPDADESTAKAPETGYAGSFHVYGYGQPPPPAIAEAKTEQPEDGGPIAPIEKRLQADEAAVRVALQGSDQLTITVISVPADPGGAAPARPFEQVEALFDRATTEQ